MQRWEGLEALVAVGETGNFTRAAGRLGISISQVSREIGRLEERLGIRLVVRNTRKVALTENGRLFQRRCRQLIDEREAAFESITSGSRANKGLIRRSRQPGSWILGHKRHTNPAIKLYDHNDSYLPYRHISALRGGLYGGRPMVANVAGIIIPDSAMARQAEQIVRDCEPEFLFNHSVRVYLFGALLGQNLKLKYDAELLYISSLFHDLGLLDQYASDTERFEVDGANTARDFLRGYGIEGAPADLVWEAIALHTTPGIPQHMRPEIALTRAGVRTDVVGTDFDKYNAEQRDAVMAAFPRHDFKNAFIEAQARSGMAKPQTTFGTINSDYIEWVDPNFKRTNQCQNILNAPWPE